MVWIHLSGREIFKRLVLNPHEADPEKGIVAYQEKPRPQGESGPEGISIAPTIWQCVISTLHYGERYIYRVHVEKPEEGGPEIADMEMTDEYVITKEVLKANGGSIEFEYLGAILVDKNIKTNLKVLWTNCSLPKHHNQELSDIWFENDRYFVLRKELCSSL